MEITKDKLKRSAIAAAAAGGFSQYLGAAIVNDFDLVKNHKLQQFWDAFNYNLAHPISSISNALSNEMFTQIQPFLLGGTLFLAGKVLFDKEHKYEDASAYGAYGTSRWAKYNEIFDKENITNKIKNEGTILGIFKGKPIIHHRESWLNRNISIVGGSGAGKTRSMIISNILKNKEKSIVVIDPKGELYEKTSQTKREDGYEVHLVNFKNRDISDRYNLFDYLRRDADAFKIADTMANNAGEGTKIKKDFWNQSQISILQALILYVKYTLPPEQQHMGSVFNLANSPIEAIYAAFQEYDPSHIVRRAYANSIEKLLGNPKTLADVFQTLLQTLNPWQYDDVCQFTAANDFLFEDLGKKKMIVYVILPIADNEFRPLITTFFSQLFSELYLLADNHYGELPNGVILYLDEFANIGKIPNFEERLSTTRSLGIEVNIVLQDTSQLENRYGKDLAKEILNNCDIKMLLKTTEYETAKYFSYLAGKTTIRIKNQSSSKGSKSSSTNESYSYMGRDLITPDEITRMKKNEELLFISGQYPMKVNKSWFDQIKEYKNLMKNKVSRDDYPVPDRGDYKAFVPNIPTKEELKAIMAGIKFNFEDEKEPETFIFDDPAPENKETIDQLISLTKKDEESAAAADPEPEEKEIDSLDDLMSNFKF